MDLHLPGCNANTLETDWLQAGRAPADCCLTSYGAQATEFSSAVQGNHSFQTCVCHWAQYGKAELQTIVQVEDLPISQPVFRAGFSHASSWKAYNQLN